MSDTRPSMHAAGRRCPDRPAASYQPRRGQLGELPMTPGIRPLAEIVQCGEPNFLLHQSVAGGHRHSHRSANNRRVAPAALDEFWRVFMVSSVSVKTRRVMLPFSCPLGEPLRQAKWHGELCKRYRSSRGYLLPTAVLSLTLSPDSRSAATPSRCRDAGRPTRGARALHAGVPRFGAPEESRRSSVRPSRPAD